jgi:hypothetical protein
MKTYTSQLSILKTNCNTFKCPQHLQISKQFYKRRMFVSNTLFKKKTPYKWISTSTLYIKVKVYSSYMIEASNLEVFTFFPKY